MSKLGLTFDQHIGHMETGPPLKVSAERLEKRGFQPTTPGLVV